MQQLQELESSDSELVSLKAVLQEENRNLKIELDNITQLAASVIAIDDENNELKGEHESLLREIDSLVVFNQQLEDTSNQQWFLRGAGIVLAGLLVGFWIARRIYHRRADTGWV